MELLELKEKIGQEYFMKETDYAKIYSKIEIETTTSIIKSNEFKFNQKRGTLIEFIPGDRAALLKETCYKSLKEHNLENETYTQRLDYELGVIIKMNFVDYFLILLIKS